MAASANPERTERDGRLLEKAMHRYASRLRALVSEWPESVPGTFPELNANNGAVVNTDVAMEASCLPGLLWLIPEHLGTDEFRGLALETAWRFAELRKKTVLYDYLLCVYRAAGWGYGITGDEDLRAVTLDAAKRYLALWDDANGVFLMRKYPPEPGALYAPRRRDRTCSVPVGLSEGPEHEYETILDVSYSFEVLFWASRYDPSYGEMALTHLESLLRLGLIRDDGTCSQALNFDPKTREPKRLHNHQAESDAHTWPRGLAWALLSFGQAYEATKRQFCLDVYDRLVRRWTELVGDEIVPFYDMSDRRVPHVPRDSDAAAIVLASLVRVSQADPRLKARYGELTSQLLEELVEHYQTPGGLLLHGTWGRFFEPPVETITEMGNHYLMEATFVGLNPERWAEVRGY